MGITRLRVAGVAAVAILSVLAAGASASTFEVTGLVVDATLLHRSPGIRCRGDRLSRAPRRQLSGHRHVVHRQHADESGQHTYRVRGIKADGTLSGAASVYVVYDVLPPADIAAAPTGDRLTSGKPTITWTAVRDAGRSGVKQYNIRRDGRLPRLGAQRDRHLHRSRCRLGSALLHRPRRGCSRQ
jgi:hypothetical protein